MPDQIKLSIITPVYNGRPFIEKCINNFLSQKCPEAEHIIVDGGSTDGTIDCIERYARTYPFVKWISTKGLNQSASMNKGLKMARGSIVSFLNVDDFYETGVFNEALEIFKSMPTPSMVVGNCNIWDEKGGLLFVGKPKKMRFKDLLLGPGINPHPLNPASYFYHKSLHEKAGLYDEKIEIAMDQDFVFRAVRVAHIKYIDKIWGNFFYTQGYENI
jgi:glycosyltransferase involved in cell wall biosynthesis